MEQKECRMKNKQIAYAVGAHSASMVKVTTSCAYRWMDGCMVGWKTDRQIEDK